MSDRDAPDEHPTAVEPASGPPTEAKVFASIGAFYLVIGAVYAATADEWAGVVLLGLGGAFALTVAAFLTWQVRRSQSVAAASEWGEPGAATTPLYLPHSSVWPFGIGLGAALTLAGVAIGWWVWLPGAALLAHSLIGFAAQSRDRT